MCNTCNNENNLPLPPITVIPFPGNDCGPSVECEEKLDAYCVYYKLGSNDVSKKLLALDVNPNTNLDIILNKINTRFLALDAINVLPEYITYAGIPAQVTLFALLNSLQSEIASFTPGDNTSVLNRLTALETDLTAVQSQIVTLNSNVSTLQSQYSSLNTAVGNINGTILGINHTLENLNDATFANTNNIITLQSSVTTMQGQITGLQTSYSNLNTLVQDNANSVITINNTLSDVDSRLDVLETDLALLQQDVQDLIDNPPSGGGVSDGSLKISALDTTNKFLDAKLNTDATLTKTIAPNSGDQVLTLKVSQSVIDSINAKEPSVATANSSLYYKGNKTWDSLGNDPVITDLTGRVSTIEQIPYDYKVCSTLSVRDNIPLAKRQLGMLTYVVSEDITYRLVATTDNTGWQPVVFTLPMDWGYTP